MSIVDIFGSTAFMLMVVIIIMGGGAVLVTSLKPEKRVELLRPRDSRGKILTVVEETDIGLTCKPSGGVTYRFIKAGRGWTYSVRGKMITKFFGIEGTAYTGIIKGDDIVNVSVSEFLRFVWHDKFYDAIPAQQRQAIESDVHGITIEVQKIDEDSLGLPTLRPVDIHDEDESVMIRRFVKGAQNIKPGSYMNYVATGLIGALLMYLAIKQGWF